MWTLQSRAFEISVFYLGRSLQSNPCFTANDHLYKPADDLKNIQ